MPDPSFEATELAGDPTIPGAPAIRDPAEREQDSPSDAQSTPERIGRYLVLRRLGAGAMGVVVIAYDPELDRRLAIKLIHPRVAKREEARSRMLREAKGLARLSHSNVVQIYDAGTIDGRVFIAMELVDGQPLSAWRKARERSTDEILAVYLDAGRGLAAAHDAGLVHRDFKPDNVLVDREGRAKVLDFGLVRAVGSEAEGRERSAGHPAAGEPASLTGAGLEHTHESGPITRELDGEATGGRVANTASELELDLTHGGQIMGTPAYMSPEQWKGAKADARSDQFSFCVALWEALYGERPFSGRTVHALAAAIGAGALAEPSGAVRLPRRVRKALERGLSRAPGKRFPSMHELLRELGREDWSGRSLPLAIAALAAFGLLAWGSSVAVGPTPAAPACEGAGTNIAASWNDERRAAIAAAFAASEVAGSEAVLAKVARDLDDYAARWVAAAQDNCAATRIRQQQSDELLDLRGACLDAKLIEFDALVEVLGRADAAAVDQAVAAVEGLPSLRACEPEQVRESGPRLPDDPALAERVGAARRALAGVRASHDTGRYAEVGELLPGVEQEIGELDFPPLTAELELERGRYLARMDRHEDGAAAMQRSYFMAVRLGDLDLAIRAANWLAETEGAQRHRPEFAELWVAQAQALLGPDPRRYPEFAADIADTASWNAYLRDDLEAARDIAVDGLAVLDEAGLEAPARRLTLLLDRGAAEYGLGDLAGAEATFEAALRIAEASLGRDNAITTSTLNNLAITLMAEAEYEQARALLSESLAVREQALGGDNASVGRVLSNLADVEIELGDGPAALAAAERGYRILVESAGPDQFATVLARQRLGLALALVGRHGEALTELQATRDLAQAPPDPDPSLTVELTGQLAAVAAAAGEQDRAQDELEAVANSDPMLWPDVISAGRFARKLGQPEVAESLLRRAIDLAGRPPDAAGRRSVAIAKLALAELLLDADPAAASALLTPELREDLSQVPKLTERLDRLEVGN